MDGANEVFIFEWYSYDEEDLDDFENSDELYVVGFKSPFWSQPTSIGERREDFNCFDKDLTSDRPFKTLPFREPQCMVQTCTVGVDLAACAGCGLAFACHEHTEDETFKAHSSDCEQLISAKEDLSAWSVRFSDWSQQDPSTVVFDREFLKSGKERDANFAKDQKSSFWWSPLEWRNAAQLCDDADCRCYRCQIIARKSRHPHQHALDGYCEAYARVLHKTANIARQANSGPALIESILLDQDAFRRGLSGGLTAESLMYGMAMGDPGVNAHFTCNAIMSYEKYWKEMLSLHIDENTEPHTALSLSQKATCGPLGGYSFYQGHLAAVSLGCIFRDLEGKDSFESATSITTEFSAEEPGDLESTLLGASPQPWEGDSIQRHAELRLLLYVEALVSLKAVALSTSCLRSRLPDELVLLIHQHTLALSPVITHNEKARKAISNFEDLQPFIQHLETESERMYDYLDESHYDIVETPGEVQYLVWMPHFIRFFGDRIKTSYERPLAFQGVLDRHSGMKLWIENRNREKYPGVTNILDSLESSPSEPNRPCLNLKLFAMAHLDKFGKAVPYKDQDYRNHGPMTKHHLVSYNLDGLSLTFHEAWPSDGNMRHSLAEACPFIFEEIPR